MKLPPINKTGSTNQSQEGNTTFTQIKTKGGASTTRAAITTKAVLIIIIIINIIIIIIIIIQIIIVMEAMGIGREVERHETEVLISCLQIPT
jgi:hypothetical protein